MPWTAFVHADLLGLIFSTFCELQLNAVGEAVGYAVGYAVGTSVVGEPVGSGVVGTVGEELRKAVGYEVTTSDSHTPVAASHRQTCLFTAFLHWPAVYRPHW